MFDFTPNVFISSFIQECLAIWARSPKAYSQLRCSGMLILPCEGTLCLYKNSISQTPGIIPEMFTYMVKEAELHKLPSHGYSGGILFDEMSIQVSTSILISILSVTSETELGANIY